MIECGGGPSDGRMADRTVGGESGGGVTRIGGPLIVRLMASDTRRAGEVEIIVHVT